MGACIAAMCEMCHLLEEESFMSAGEKSFVAVEFLLPQNTVNVESCTDAPVYS